MNNLLAQLSIEPLTAVLFIPAVTAAVLALLPVPLILAGAFWFQRRLYPRYAAARDKKNAAANDLAKIAIDCYQRAFSLGRDAYPAVNAATIASLHQQLRGLQQYSWLGWNDAATWAIENKTNYEEALKWADTSIQNEERYENLDTKAQLLRLSGKTAEADAVQQKAVAGAGSARLSASTVIDASVPR